MSFQIATDEDSGVLLYKGDSDHIAAELYRGRLRVSYDTGSYPPSAIYRYAARKPTKVLSLARNGSRVTDDSTVCPAVWRQ